MRYEVKAVEDMDRGYADRHFTHKKGDKVELSSAGYEMVMSESFGGGFEFVREIPETDAEKERVRLQEEKAKLMEKPKETLVKQAEKLNIPTDQNKEPLAKAIVEAKKGDKK